MSSSQMEHVEKVCETKSVVQEKEDVQDTAVCPSQEPQAVEDMPLGLPKQQEDGNDPVETPKSLEETSQNNEV